jgi:hypothetical protein
LASRSLLNLVMSSSGVLMFVTDSTAAMESWRRRHSCRKNRKYSSPMGDHGATTAIRL